MVNLQKFLNDKGLADETANSLREELRVLLSTASNENRLPDPSVRKLPYKRAEEEDRTPMDELCDALRDTMNAHRIPCNVFASIVKMVLSSDVADRRRKVSRANVRMETAMVARSTSKVLYNAAKIGEKTEMLKLDEAFATLDTADILHQAAGLEKSTAEIVNCKAQMERSSANVNQATANIVLSTATTTESTANIVLSTATTTEATANIILSTATSSQAALAQCHQLDLDIKQAQLVEARSRAALATLQLNEAQAAAAAAAAALQQSSSTNTVVAVVPARARHITCEVTQGPFLSMPAVRPISKKKRVKFQEGTKAT